MAIDPTVGAEQGPVIRSTGVGVLDRAMAILDVVERGPMTASELARHLGLSVPTAHRLTAAMIAHGLVRRGPDGLLHPGQRFTVSSLATTAVPVIEDLRRATGETAQIWVRRGEHRLCLLTADSPEELRASVPAGTLLALSTGGSAAAVLIGAPDEPEGWIESVARRTPGLCSVSAPVRLHDETVAAIGVSAPLSRMGDGGPGARFGTLVTAAARRLEGLADPL